jgi:hypothetical protein
MGLAPRARSTLRNQIPDEAVIAISAIERASQSHRPAVRATPDHSDLRAPPGKRSKSRVDADRQGCRVLAVTSDRDTALRMLESASNPSCRFGASNPGRSYVEWIRAYGPVYRVRALELTAGTIELRGNGRTCCPLAAAALRGGRLATGRRPLGRRRWRSWTAGSGRRGRGCQVRPGRCSSAGRRPGRAPRWSR